MKENKYDDAEFFEKYARMDRSRAGLAAAGEWHAFKSMLPDFSEKRVLDLGCGYGWHCRYAVDHGAASAVGVDLSERMIADARARNDSPHIQYVRSAIEDVVFPDESFDVVLSSLALHYVAQFSEVCAKVWRCLAWGGFFAFSVEHPIFTAAGNQQWHCAADGTFMHWPVDRYFEEGARSALFLGETVVKYHRTLGTMLGEVMDAGFRLGGVVEPTPDPALMDSVPGMRDELRRPMMLLVAAEKAKTF